jgi:hypothetical protein
MAELSNLSITRHSQPGREPDAAILGGDLTRLATRRPRLGRVVGEFKLKALTKMSETNEPTAPRPIGILKNPRWERFAHEIARGSTADKSYVAAGYAQSRGNASRLRSVEIVDRRVGELKKMVAEIQKLSTHKTVLTQAFVIENLIGIVGDARALDDFAGANRALHLLGMELGLFTERKEIGRPGEFTGLTIAAKRERWMTLARQLGLGYISSDGMHRFGIIDQKDITLSSPSSLASPKPSTDVVPE